MCEIIEKRIVKYPGRLFEEEIDMADFLCFSNNIGYEQLFAALLYEKFNSGDLTLDYYNSKFFKPKGKIIKLNLE